MNEKIDFIMPWVDGNDPDWQKEKAKYKGSGSADTGIARYRDWDNLQYWFRGVEKFTPWVNKIFFITYGHLPSWLNKNHPKIQIVNHHDYIPKEYLPVFSSRPIELNIHRIRGLSDHFVYFNDDIFILRSLDRNYFFKNGMPCDTAALSVIGSHELTQDIPYLNAVHIINQHFSKKEMMDANKAKWFNLKYRKQLARTLLLMPWKDITGFYKAHGPNAYLKESIEKVWEKERAILQETCRHKFRESSDVTQMLFKMWQLCEGTFEPRYDRCLSLDINCNTNYLSEIFLGKKYPLICLNDSHMDDFEETKQKVNALLDKILPEKSSYEL